MKEFPKTNRTTITRLPKRGDYSTETIYAILDEALFCTLAYCQGDQPFQIPTGFCRVGNQLYVHGSVGSTYMRKLAEGGMPVSISVALMDGLVLARSAFHHSVNYRSVALFSTPRLVTEDSELYQALEVFTEKMCKGRWADVRKPTRNEWKATMVLAFTIEEASAKLRVGDPKDDEEDYALDVWAGVLPLTIQKGTPVPDQLLKPGVAFPDYLK